MFTKVTWRAWHASFRKLWIPVVDDVIRIYGVFSHAALQLLESSVSASLYRCKDRTGLEFEVAVQCWQSVKKQFVSSDSRNDMRLWRMQSVAYPEGDNRQDAWVGCLGLNGIFVSNTLSSRQISQLIVFIYRSLSHVTIFLFVLIVHDLISRQRRNFRGDREYGPPFFKKGDGPPHFLQPLGSKMLQVQNTMSTRGL